MSLRHRLIKVTLDERTLAPRGADIEHERKVAIFDLLEDNHFRPLGAVPGPYSLHLSAEEGRLVFEIRGADEQDIDRTVLPLSPFRRLIKEYMIVRESYFEAIKKAPRAQIEALDMGRRGLHNDGSELLRQRLDGKIDLDFDTARRLFTLLCVLHLRG